MMSKQNDWENPLPGIGQTGSSPRNAYFSSDMSVRRMPLPMSANAQHGYQSLKVAWRFRLFNGSGFTVPQQALLSIADDWDEAGAAYVAV